MGGPFDFKAEYKDLCQPKPEPGRILVPPMTFIMVNGAGDPNEPDTVARMEACIADNGPQNDIGETRRHPEIFLSDPRRADPKHQKTILRIPVKERT